MKAEIIANKDLPNGYLIGRFDNGTDLRTKRLIKGETASESVNRLWAFAIAIETENDSSVSVEIFDD